MIIDKVKIDEKKMREDIIAHVNKNIFVEAGAGAGKTTLIVGRVINQIRQGMRPEQIVVITFTNAAAGELFERIESALVKEEKNERNTEQERSNFTYAAEHMEQMTISTIHSFCYKLLQQRCFDAKLPLDVALLEEQETKERKKTFFEKWFSKLDRDTLLQMREAVEVATNWKNYYKWLEAAFYSICEKADDVQVVGLTDAELTALKKERDDSKEAVKNCEKDLLEELALFLEALPVIIGRETSQTLSVSSVLSGKVLYAKYDHLLAALNDGETDEVLKSKEAIESLYSGNIPDLYKKGRTDASKALAGKIDTGACLWIQSRYRAGEDNAYKKWQKAQELAQEKAISYAYFLLIKHASEARRLYAKTLDGKEMSNDELLQRAKQLVWTSEQAREFFRKKYKCIYVDEFQDTDHIQADLIWKLACDEKDGLREGALFVVGDPKQAIYRFRGGEPAVYYSVKKRMSEMGAEAEVYELDNNYRSGEEIIDWVNEQFGEVFGDNYSKMQCTMPDNIVSTSDETVLAGVYRFPMNFPVKSSVDEKAGNEAEALAQFVHGVVNGKYMVYDTKREQDGSYTKYCRSIRYDDFLILCWSMKQMQSYLKELEKWDIPVNLSGKTSLKGNYALQSYVRLFAYLVHSRDPKCKQAALHIVARGDTSQDEEMARARLARLQEEVKGMTHRAIAFYLAQHPEYLLPWDAVLTRAQISSMQSKLLLMTETVLAQSDEDPMLLTEAFETYIEKAQEHELSMEEDANAVRFMNLHKAKGLEGTITILVNRKSYWEPEEPSAYTKPEKNAEGMYEYYGAIEPEKKEEGFFKVKKLIPYNYNADYQKIATQSIMDNDAEHRRLEYVAATRAKQVLVVFDAFNSGDHVQFGKYSLQQHVPTDYKASTDASNKAGAAGGAASTYMPVMHKQLTESMLRPLYVSLSPSMLEEHSMEEEIEEDVTAERRPKGNIFGTTMHRSFELYVKRRGEDDLSVDACICQAIMENYEDLLSEGKRLYLKEEEEPEIYPEKVREYLIKALERFAQSSEIQVLFDQAKEVYPELQFSYYTSKEEEPEFFEELVPYLRNHKIEIPDGMPVWVNGTADLVVVGQDGSVSIIDYKSDTKKVSSMETFEHILSRRYEGQLKMYRHCMGRLFDVPKEQVSTSLYHLYK